MNTYAKYCPNVFVAKCPEPHEKGETILVTTKHGKENECVVFNLVHFSNGFYYYSIVRADGFNRQEWARRKAERLGQWAEGAEAKSHQAYEASNKHRDFLSLGEPIKIGHHSERRHRKIIDEANNNMRKCVELSDKADRLKDRAAYWAARTEEINLSMPESIEYFEYKLEEARLQHEQLKSGEIAHSHSFSLTYAKKEVNELEKKLDLAKKLWA